MAEFPDNIERRMISLESEFKGAHDQLVRIEAFMKFGITPGAEREIVELNRTVSKIQEDLNKVVIKTTKWEGGSSVLLFIIGILGTAVGWVLSHLGVGPR